MERLRRLGSARSARKLSLSIKFQFIGGMKVGEPPEDGRHNTPEMQQLLEYISRHNDDLLKSMTDEQKKIFEKYHDCWSKYASLAEAAIFEYAFRLGMQIAIETLK